MGYFLVVDKAVLKYSNDFDKVLNTLADMYGGRIAIDYYGLITRSEILSMEYMDTHEGCCFFISGLKLINFENKTEKDISINIYRSGYLMEYVDDEDEDGYIIIDWLKANKDRCWLDYSKRGLKKYCIMVEGDFQGSFDTLEEAYNFLKKDELYGNLRVAIPSNDEILLKDTDLKCMKDSEGYHYFYYNVISKNEEGGMEFDIAIIELDTVFNHFHKSNAYSLARYLDRDRSTYNLNILDYEEIFDKTYRMFVKMFDCKNCYEFIEKLSHVTNSSHIVDTR